MMKLMNHSCLRLREMSVLDEDINKVYSKLRPYLNDMKDEYVSPFTINKIQELKNICNRLLMKVEMLR